MIFGGDDPEIPSQAWAETDSQGRTVRTFPLQFNSIPEQVIFLKDMIRQWRGRTWTRETAIGIIKERGCPPKERLCQALAIAEWVQARIYYVNERPEVFQTPLRTVELGAGDCDDHTTLIGSLLESIGIPVEIVAVKVNGKWQHIFPIAHVRLKSQRVIPVPLDTTLSRPVREMADPIRLALQAGKTVETLRQ